MEEHAKLIEALLERATDYGKTSYELVKLKAIDKTSDAVSSFIPNLVALIIIGAFILFLSFGSALWLGEILGKIYYGFFVVGAFYFIIWFILYFFMLKWLKKITGNYFVKNVFK